MVLTGRIPGELALEFDVLAAAIPKWVRQADRDEGRRTDSLTSEERQKLVRLGRENQQLREEREAL